MTQMLNLNEVAAVPDKVLKIDGVEYPMVELSVETFLAMSAKAEALEKSGGTPSVSEQVEMLVDSVRYAFPTCPAEVLRARPLSQLYLIVDFVRGEMESGSEEVAEKK